MSIEFTGPREWAGEINRPLSYRGGPRPRMASTRVPSQVAAILGPSRRPPLDPLRPTGSTGSGRIRRSHYSTSVPGVIGSGGL